MLPTSTGVRRSTDVKYIELYFRLGAGWEEADLLGIRTVLAPYLLSFETDRVDVWADLEVPADELDDLKKRLTALSGVPDNIQWHVN